MSDSLIQIDRWRCDNRGGVARVKLVIPEDVATYASPTAEAGIVVKPGKEIYHIEVDPRTGGHQEQLKGGDQGDYYERSVSFDVRRLRQEVTTLKGRLRNRRVHVIFTDENGLTYLYLNQRLRSSTATNQYRTKNRTDFTFSGASRLPAPYVIGELLPEPDPTDVTIGDTQTEPDLGNEGADNSGGSAGGGLGDDLGDGNPNNGGDGGGGGDPGGGTPTDPADVVFLQPSTGDYFRITIGECEEVITTKVTP